MSELHEDKRIKEQEEALTTHDNVEGVGFEERDKEEKYVISTRNLIPSCKGGIAVTTEERRTYAKKFLDTREKNLKVKKRKK